MSIDFNMQLQLQKTGRGQSAHTAFPPVAGHPDKTHADHPGKE